MTTYGTRPRTSASFGGGEGTYPKPPGTQIEEQIEEQAEESARRAGRKLEGMKQEARHAGERIKEGAVDVRERIKSGARTLSTKSFKETYESCRGYIQKNPGKVILTSLAVGWAMGAVGALRRGNRKGGS